jgi:hypothetical protein
MKWRSKLAVTRNGYALSELKEMQMTRAKNETARLPRPSSPLRREYYEILCDQGVVEDAEKVVAEINTMSAAELRQAIAASRDEAPLRVESKHLVAKSLDDIAEYFDVHAIREEGKPTERTQRAQAFRNGLVHAYRDAATSLRMMQLRPDTGAALRDVCREIDGKTYVTPDPSYTIAELISFLRAEHANNPMHRPNNRSCGEIADWLELYFEKPTEKRKFYPMQVERPDAGGKLYAPVDQFGRESGDTPSYDSVAIAKRCEELNSR